MSRFYNPKHPEWFRQWQIKFYNSKQWKKLREEVRTEKGMRCDHCHRLIKGKSICDHIKEITPDNYTDEVVTLNKRNLQLLCIECHNTKTFYQEQSFEPNKERNVNLF